MGCYWSLSTCEQAAHEVCRVVRWGPKDRGPSEQKGWTCSDKPERALILRNRLRGHVGISVGPEGQGSLPQNLVMMLYSHVGTEKLES